VGLCAAWSCWTTLEIGRVPHVLLENTCQDKLALGKSTGIRPFLRKFRVSLPAEMEKRSHDYLDQKARFTRRHLQRRRSIIPFFWRMLVSLCIEGWYGKFAGTVDKAFRYSPCPRVLKTQVWLSKIADDFNQVEQLHGCCTDIVDQKKATRPNVGPQVH
jgi:hypothetical protein